MQKNILCRKRMEVDLFSSFSTTRLITQFIEQPFMEKAEFNNTPFETIDLGSNVFNNGHEIMNFLKFQGDFHTKLIRKSKIEMRTR